MARPFLFLALCTALAGCGSQDQPAADAATPSEAGSPTAAAAVTCADLPEHAVLLPDAAISLCTRGQVEAGHESGTVIYTTGKSGDEVLAFYRQVAADKGLNPGVATAMSLSATQGTRRSFMAMVARAGGQTQVTLNWGRDL